MLFVDARLNMTRIDTDAARSILERAIANGVFPAAAVEVGGSGNILWRDAFGKLTFDAGARPTTVDTPFDLASLTKPIATTTVAMGQVAAGHVGLDERVEDIFSEWRGADRKTVTVRDLLEHSSGLAARLIDLPPDGRREFEHEICTMRLDYIPRTQSIYSDLGFILLGFLLEDRTRRSLAVQFKELIVQLQQQPGIEADAIGEITFLLPLDERRRAAPTLPMHDDSRRGRPLVGEVHDNYAAALGGIAGHAGLFGTVSAVGAFARLILRAARGDDAIAVPLAADLVRLMTAKSSIPASSRALGWDTMLPTSSCGTRMSPAAFGHVGFTGTSLWIDPVRDRYFVLLTNRAYGGGSLDDMRTVRRAFHDALPD